MILKKKAIILIALMLSGCIITLFTGKSLRTATTSAKNVLRPTIILDAGHGGFDGGAVANDGTVEKNINLEITLCLAEFLRQSGYEVIFTRESDVSTDNVESDRISTRKKSDLQNRLKLMNDYPDAVFISIHLNKFTTSAANGSQVFYGSKNENSKFLGEKVQEKIISFLQPYNKRANKQATDSTYILHNAEIPAILVECGFLSNASDLEKLKTKEYQTEMAFCIFCGIIEYFSKGDLNNATKN